MKKTSRIVTWLCVFALFAGLAPAVLPQSSASAYAAGDTIALGSYPQTHVTDEALIDDLNAAAADSEWQTLPFAQSGSLELVKYSDIQYEDTMYRRIRILRSLSGATAGNGYNTGVVYWFRFEPINWILLDADAGFAIAEMVLDTEPFTYPGYYENGTFYRDSSGVYYMNNFAQSDIRAWLNDTFLPTAFSTEEAAVLELHTSDNSIVPNEACESYICEDTTDYVSLLSLEETSYFSGDADAVRNATDYALALGCDNYGFGDRNQYWFLRTPGTNSSSNCYISPQGSYGTGIDTGSPDVGVVPTVYISLSEYAALKEAEETDPNDDGITFVFQEGILTVSGTGTVPTVEAADDAPFAPYADDCRVIVIDSGIDAVQPNAFAGLDQVKTLILNGPVTLEAGAFAANGAIETVICADAVHLTAASFTTEEYYLSIYEPKSAPHTGDLPADCDVLSYSFADGTLFVEGRAEMDVYTLLDLMTVMCSYYDDVRFVHFTSYTSLDVPFYVYDRDKEAYVPAPNHTLKGVSFSVKVENEDA